MSEQLKTSIINEAKRKHDDALYTSTGLFEWHKRLRFYKTCFLVFELAIGAACVWALQSGYTVIGSVFGLIAGIGPTIIDAFKLDEKVAQTSSSANEFRSLKAKYRRIADVWSNKSVGSLERRFQEVNSEYDAVSTKSYPLPDYYFKIAQTKIKNGDYAHNEENS